MARLSTDTLQLHPLMREEVRALEENDTHELTPLTEGRSPVGDPCVYTKLESNMMVIIVIWVDDIMIAASCRKVLDGFQISDCKPESVPCDPSVNNEIFCDSKELADARLYREIVGSLIYIITGARPDICYVVTRLSQYMSNPSKADLILAKYVVRYLKGTLHYELKFSKSVDELKVTGSCDSDWGTSSDRRSVTVYCY
ncbi:uncharacterized protein [Macrobrachium rosenbergii]|uniref:uncharacterized protein n=1 Tax=Macrobrachium rosenbergii TaxID=79674 RepID=UPI0034D5304D